MIVKCEQCQTRFKVPDDKITDRGVKVRCTKCGNTFRTMRDGTQQPVNAKAPTGEQGPAVADPFARFGAPAEASALEETRPGVFSLGVEATRVPDLTHNKAFDFSSLAPPAAGSKATGGASGPNRSQAAATTSPPASKRPAGPSSPTRPVSALPVAPFDFSSLTAPPGGSPAPPAAAVPQAVAPPSIAPFDFGSLGPTSPGVRSPFAFQKKAAPAAPAGAPFDFSSLGPPAAGPSVSTSAPPPPPPPAPVPPAVPAPGVTSTLPEVPAPAPKAQPKLVAEVPDFFGSTDEHSGVQPPPSEVRGALFDMAAALPPAAEDKGPTLPPPEPADLIGARRLPFPGALPAAQPAVSAARAREGSGLGARPIFGVVVNVAIALVLLAGVVVVGSAYVNEGKLDSRVFSVERVVSLLRPPSALVARDVSNGLYDTAAGRAVFYVRGEVVNRGDSAQRIQVRAELLDGETLVRWGEVFAGSPPTPEELHALTAVEELDRLNAKLAIRAGPVAPGASAPFLVTFFEYPPDLRGFRVRVAARPEERPTAAR